MTLKDLNTTRKTLWELAGDHDTDLMDIAHDIGEELYDRAYKENPRLPWIEVYNYDIIKQMAKDDHPELRL